ncbi:hypothetical protein [Falsiroseomonas tokyonensis]|uniref:Terminase small subunit n=1 Tax=Falsiroseomonas tokyonensis TaxID=430521 RepID=A0ABV7BXX1_9PROT|nr:hypothetical protein [Falsiroseomonas tokyonensis]MBU8539487.1 hypothetical protein [Falsiroseomonas tokyonensis]
MALSNADRQRRHRERIKARLSGEATQMQQSQPGDGSPELAVLMAAAYREAGLALIGKHAGDGAAGDRAVREFSSTPVTGEVLLDAVKAAGQWAAVRLFEREVNADIAAARTRPAWTPPVYEAAPRRASRRGK